MRASYVRARTLPALYNAVAYFGGTGFPWRRCRRRPM